MADTKRVRALVAKTEFVPGFGMVVMNNGGERDEARFPTVPVKAIEDLISKGLIADDFKPGMLGEKTDKPQLDHDSDGKAGGSLPKAQRKPKAAGKKPADPELGEARKRYREVFGKNPGPKWSVDEIDAKIAEERAEAGDADTSGGGGEEPPPAE